MEDPGNWRCEGVIYRKMQDPLNGAPYDSAAHGGRTRPEIRCPLGTPEAPRMLFAPDAAKGPDGRYYLYYALDFANVISVAVSDSPAGPFEFLDYVTYEDGRIPEAGNKFDPAILSEESGNYLYYGFAPQFRFPGQGPVEGAMMVRLADDMHTVISDPVCVANGFDTAEGTCYAEHPFFEASSIRHFGEWYYFVYSSLQGNELCYGMAKTPEGPFEFKGVIVSNGDIGYHGNTLPVNYMGNNHGGLVQAGDKTYIFWHRHINGTQYSRQGCADEVHFEADGTIPQIEITSCGLNGGPLPAVGRWQTYIACRLTQEDQSAMGNALLAGPGEPLPPVPEEWPLITTEECDELKRENDKNCGDVPLRPLIKNLRKGSTAGFKYFAFTGSETSVTACLRGSGKLEMHFDSPDNEPAAVLECDSAEWKDITAEFAPVSGTHALYFRTGEGVLDFSEFSF